MITKVTLKQLEAWEMYEKGIEYWKKINKPNVLEFIERCKKDNQLDWAIWLIASCLGRVLKLRFTDFSASLALPMFEKQHPNDNRPRKAIKALEEVIKDDTKKNRDKARSASNDAKIASAKAASHASGASYASAAAASAAADAASAAAYAASADVDADVAPAYAIGHVTLAAAYDSTAVADAATNDHAAHSDDTKISAACRAAIAEWREKENEMRWNILQYGIELLKKEGESEGN